jgi:hypothetical protein
MSTDETQPLGTTSEDTQADAPHGATTPGTTTPGTTPDGAAPAAAASTHPGVRVSSIVGGVITVLLGVGVLLVAAGYTIDVQLAAIVLLIAAGAGLILGPLVQGLRRGRTALR